MELLAEVYGKLQQETQQLEVLQQLVKASSNPLPALRVLIERAQRDEAWADIPPLAEKFNSIHPLLSEGHLALAEAAEHLGRHRDVVRSLEAARKMEPVDPAGLHYRLASALAELDQPVRAKHHVLRALDEAPRYRAAHRLLLRLSEEPPPEPKRQPDDEPQTGDNDDGAAESKEPSR